MCRGDNGWSISALRIMVGLFPRGGGDEAEVPGERNRARRRQFQLWRLREEVHGGIARLQRVTRRCWSLARRKAGSTPSARACPRKCCWTKSKRSRNSSSTIYGKSPQRHSSATTRKGRHEGEAGRRREQNPYVDMADEPQERAGHLAGHVGNTTTTRGWSLPARSIAPPMRTSSTEDGLEKPRSS